MTDIQSLRTAYAAADAAERYAWAALASVRQDLCGTLERAMWCDTRHMHGHMVIAKDAVTYSDHAYLEWLRARDAKQAAAAALVAALEQQT